MDEQLDNCVDKQQLQQYGVYSAMWMNCHHSPYVIASLIGAHLSLWIYCLWNVFVMMFGHKGDKMCVLDELFFNLFIIMMIRSGR